MTKFNLSTLLAGAVIAPMLMMGVSAQARVVANKAETELNLTNNRISTPVTDAVLAKLLAAPVVTTSQTRLAALLRWHGYMLDANAVDHTPGPMSGDQQGPVRNARAFAMVQIAVYDAVNTFQNKYKPYLYSGVAPAGASMRSAIAYAAHDALVALYPKQAAHIDAQLAADIAGNDASAASQAAGCAIGQAAAAAMVNSRISGGLATDGATAGEVNWGAGGVVAGGVTANINVGATGPQDWLPDPVGRAQNAMGMQFIRQVALGAHWGNVRPFVLTSGDQFRVPAPPRPGTAAYRQAYNEVKEIGASPDTAGSTSTAATRFIGNYWGYDGAALLGTPPRLYNQIALQVALARGLTDVSDLARYLAMTNTAMGDAGISAWDGKWYWNNNRPVTGIRNDDGDPATTADPAWKPAGASVINSDHAELFTPPFPAYPSGHATFGGALFQVMRGFFKDNTAFTFTSDEYNGLGVDPNGTPRPLAPVRFKSFTAAQKENGRSRVYNGVHWNYDDIFGQASGVQVGAFVTANAFQPVP